MDRLRRGRSGMCVAGLIKILDGCFVDQGADVAVAHLDGVGVVPLDRAFDAVAVFQHEDHAGLGVHLLLQVKGLCMRACGASVGRRRMLVDKQRGIALRIRPAILSPAGRLGRISLRGPEGGSEGIVRHQEFFALIVRRDC